MRFLIVETFDRRQEIKTRRVLLRDTSAESCHNEAWWWSRTDVLSSACLGACHQPHHVAAIVDAGEGRGQPRRVNQRALIKSRFN